MKKVLSLILAFVFVVGICASSPITLTANAASVNDLTFKLNDDGNFYYVSDCSTYALGELIIPSTYKGLPVTSIGARAFYNCTSITSVTIPDSVTSIGSEAFYGCSNLAAVYISDVASWCNIDFWGSYANPLCCAKNLYLNGKLVTDLVIPNSVTSIGSYAFYNCTSITSATIPDSVTSIGEDAFEYCESLTSVTIGNGVTSIGEDAFYGCSNLTAVYISDVASWCNIDFGNSYSNPLYYATNLYLNNSLVKNLVIPDNVTEIKSYAFYNYQLVTAIKIPNTLKSVGKDAFYACSEITIVAISDLTAWCNIDFGSSTANPLYYAKKLYLNGKLVTDLVIPQDVEIIKDYTFYNCIPLSSVTIPDSLTSIGDRAFYGCSNLNAVYISDVASWCNIDFGSSTANPLYYAKNLYLNGKLVTNLVIPEGVEIIKDYVFYNCTSLTSVAIPNSVTNIGEGAFRACDSLKYVFYAGSNVDWSNINVSSDNSKLTSTKIHYNTTDHSHNITKNLPFFEGMEGSIEDICITCGLVHSSEKLVYINDYITAIDTKNVVLDTTNNILILDISACKDISEAIVEMDGYALTTTPSASCGFIGTGSKLKVSTTSGTQVAEYTIVVRGDVNGDSVCDVLDLMVIELASNNDTTLTGVYFTAADLSEDGVIDVSDFSAAVNRALA